RGVARLRREPVLPAATSAKRGTPSSGISAKKRTRLPRYDTKCQGRTRARVEGLLVGERSWCVRILVLGLLCAAAHAQPRILVPADYGTNQLPEKVRGTWWALCVGKETLVPVKVSSHPVPDDIGPTVRIIVAGCDDAVALFRGLGERAVTWASWTSRGTNEHRT